MFTKYNLDVNMKYLAVFPNAADLFFMNIECMCSSRYSD